MSTPSLSTIIFAILCSSVALHAAIAADDNPAAAAAPSSTGTAPPTAPEPAPITESALAPAGEPAARSNAAVVTASRFAATIDTAPVNVTVVTAKEIRASHATTLADALEQLAGVHVQNLYGISGADAKVDLSGFGATAASNTLVLLNGRRLNDVDLSGANLAAIPLQTVERIEVVHGASTVLYGDSAVGGVINIVTRSSVEGPAASGIARVGSFGTRELGAQGRWANERIAFLLGADRLATDGYRDYNASTHTQLNSELSYQGDSGIWGARVSHYADEVELPGSIDEAQYDSDPTAASTFLMDTEEKQNTTEMFYQGDGVAAELAWRNKQQDAVNSWNTVTKADLTTLSFTPRLRMVNEEHVRIVGLDLYRSALDTKAHFDPAPSNGSDVTRNSVALYASDTYSIKPSVALGFGVRFQSVGTELKNTDLDTGVSTRDDSDDANLGWDLSVQFRYPGGARSHLRVANSFRFAVLDEMWSYYSGTIALLEPQQGRHFEAGGQFPLTAHTQFDASLFRMTLDDEIGFDQASFANVNLDPTEHYGGDVALKTQATEIWSLRLMYAYRDAKFRSGPLEGNHLPEIPQHKLVFGNNVDFGDYGSLTLDALFTGKRYFGDDFANEGKRMPGYTLVTAGWLWRFAQGDVRFAVNNLLDKKAADTGYYANYGSPSYSYYPLAGRALSLAVRAEF